MSSTTTIIPVENKEKQKPQIELKHSKVNDLLDSITEYLGAWSVILGTVIRFILFVIVASLIVEQFGEDKEWLMVGIIALIFFADIGFSFSALLAAKFYNLGVKHYAILFFVISVVGLLFIAWKLNDFTNVLYPLLNDDDLVTEFAKNKNSENAHLNYSLKTIFFLSDFLAFIFTEGGAYMIFAFTSKEERNSETGETRNSEIPPKHTENDVSQESEEETQGKIEELELPNKIEKTGENKFSVNGELPKDLKGFKGNARVHASKKNQAAEEGKYRKARISEVWENYYNAIIEIIEKEEAKGKTSWTVYPNGLLANDSEPKEEKINGHKLEPEFFNQ